MADGARLDRDRFRGALLGLAVGDAVGTTVEFKAPGTFDRVTDMVGGGPFGLPAGAWTDDTSMALCLAESLVERQGFDAVDQLERYVRWYREGHWSSTGRCFDIGNATRTALHRFERTQEPYPGDADPRAAGNGPLMKLAPVALAYASEPLAAVRYAAESARTTHGAPEAADACRYFAGLLVGALGGANVSALLHEGVFEPVDGLWGGDPLHPKIAAIAAGSFHAKEPPAIRSASAAGLREHEDLRVLDGVAVARRQPPTEARGPPVADARPASIAKASSSRRPDSDLQARLEPDRHPHFGAGAIRARFARSFVGGVVGGARPQVVEAVPQVLVVKARRHSLPVDRRRERLPHVASARLDLDLRLRDTRAAVSRAHRQQRRVSGIERLERDVGCEVVEAQTQGRCSSSDVVVAGLVAQPELPARRSTASRASRRRPGPTAAASFAKSRMTWPPAAATPRESATTSSAGTAALPPGPAARRRPDARRRHQAAGRPARRAWPLRDHRG